MRTVRLGSVEIAKLRLPGNWREFLAQAKASPMLASLKHIGLVHEPVVRASDMKLIAGRKRVAAHVTMGKDSVVAKFIECTDEEAELIELVENAHREHDPDRQSKETAELIRLFEGRAVEELAADDGHHRGQPKTVRGRARELAADVIGVKPQSLRMREYRAAHEKNGAAKDRPAFPFRTLGMKVSAEFVEECRAVANRLELAAQKANLAMVEMTRLAKAGLPYHSDRMDRMYDDLSSIASAMRALTPVSLCPTCKGIDEVQAQCAGCRKLGYITRSQESSIPAELWNEEDPIVYFRGKTQPLSDFARAPEPIDDPFGLGEYAPEEVSE